MMLFFIPYIVSAMALLPALGSQLVPIAAGVVAGPLIVVAVTGFAAAKLRKPDAGEETAG
jgi:putative effector of murein hydrolase LrgA (UPF0299 family)